MGNVVQLSLSPPIELRRGVGLPEDAGGENEGGSSQPERRRDAAQEEPGLPEQELPSALQPVLERRGGADRRRQEPAGLAGPVRLKHSVQNQLDY